MLHPLGRILVMFFIPMGVNAVELFGFACFIAIIVVILYPRGSLKVKLTAFREILQSKSKSGKMCPITPNDDIVKFMFELSMRDKTHKISPHFRNVIDIGIKRNRQQLVVNFISYYGNLALKFLDSIDDLSKHNVSVEIDNISKSVSAALCDIMQICDNFALRLFEDDLTDLRADITVLGQVSTIDNLK